MKTLLAGFEELRASQRTLRDKPLAILVAGRAPPDPKLDAAEVQRNLTERQAAQESLLRLSSNAVLILAKDSTHQIPEDAPGTVVRAVHAVVEAARTRGRLSEASIQRSPDAQQAAE